MKKKSLATTFSFYGYKQKIYTDADLHPSSLLVDLPRGHFLSAAGEKQADQIINLITALLSKNFENFEISKPEKIPYGPDDTHDNIVTYRIRAQAKDSRDASHACEDMFSQAEAGLKEVRASLKGKGADRVTISQLLDEAITQRGGVPAPQSDAPVPATRRISGNVKAPLVAKLEEFRRGQPQALKAEFVDQLASRLAQLGNGASEQQLVGIIGGYLNRPEGMKDDRHAAMIKFVADEVLTVLNASRRTTSR